MNILFISSTLMVLGNFPFIVISQQNTFIKSYYILGLTTSLLNHGYKSRVFEVADRAVMTLGFFIDLCYIINTYELQLLLLSVLCYFVSKSTKVGFFIKFYHVFAHFYVTVAHNAILMHYC